MRRNWILVCAAQALLATNALRAQEPPADPEAEAAPVDGGAPPPAGTPVFESAPQLQVGLFAGQSDNIGRDTTAVRSDVTGLTLAFGARRESRRIDGSLLGDIQYRRYGAEEVPETDDHEVIGSVDGRLAVHLVPQRLLWDVTQNLGQVRTNAFVAVGPENRERSTVLSTGPEAHLPVGQRNMLELRGTVAERKFEVSNEFDNRVTAAQVSLSRAVDAVTSLSFAVGGSKTRFDEQPDPYEFRTVSVAYGKQLASGGVEVRVGRGEIQIGNESNPTSIGRFAWDRAVGVRSRLSVWAQKEITDTGEIFRLAGLFGPGQVALGSFSELAQATEGRLRDAVLTRSPLRRANLGGRLDINGVRTNYSISLGAAEDRFEVEETFNNDSSTVQFSARRALGSRWTGEVSLAAWNQDFRTVDQDARDETGRLVITRSFGRNIRAAFLLERTRRVSELDPFQENFYQVSVGYDFSR